jgi:hypothetical protein
MENQSTWPLMRRSESHPFEDLQVAAVPVLGEGTIVSARPNSHKVGAAGMDGGLMC